MELTERKKQILRAIVDSYIRTAEPVGSKTISQLPGMDFSPATIRNEMADLTSMGLLEQPHTSAGRVPARRATGCMSTSSCRATACRWTKRRPSIRRWRSRCRRSTKMISQVGKLVSKMTDLPAYAVAAKKLAADRQAL